MSGTGPRQVVAIALSFGVQAVLIAGVLAIPAEMSSTVGVSSSSAVAVPAPAPESLLPAMSPLGSGEMAGQAFPVTVSVGATSEMYMYGSLAVPPSFQVKPGTDVTATVTVTVPVGYVLPSLSVGLAEEAPLAAAPAPGIWGSPRATVSVPGPLQAGPHSVTIDGGTLAPHSGLDVVMRTPASADVTTPGVMIAEIVTS
jgi:hypothetical protein